MENKIRVPKQKRSLEKYNKIISSGFDLICKNGYHNTNTAQIAKQANVSTGIVYQYFNDKHDILIAGINKYGDDIFFPVLKIKDDVNIDELPDLIRNMIDKYIKDHKLSKHAHEEIMAMVHSDEEIAKYYYQREMNLTNQMYDIFKDSNIDNLKEKIHIIIGMIENLCHEIVYHKHKELDYKIMTDIIIKAINDLIKKLS